MMLSQHFQHHRNTVLTDGIRHCTYGELDTVVSIIVDKIAAADVSDEDWLAVRSNNTLPCAILILALIESHRAFLLLPPGGSAEEVNPPRFCRYQFDINDNKIDEVFMAWPEAIEIIEYQNWNGKSPAKGEGRVCLLTSGSTGVPKVVVHDIAQLLINARNCVQRLQLDSNDRLVIPVPLHHLYGLGAAFLPAILAGAAIELQQGANVVTFTAREKIFNPSVAFLTPTFCATLLKIRRTSHMYRLTVVAGDRMPARVHHDYENFFGTTVSLYGSTELGAISACGPDDSPTMRSNTVGRPMTGVQLYETESVQSLAEELHEMHFLHDSAFLGYLDDNGGMQIATSPFPSHDLGRVTAEGAIKVFGRTDHCVNRDGRLVAFAYVEQAVQSLPEVESVVVVASGETSRGRGLVALCVSAPGASWDSKRLRKHCLEILPGYVVPDIFLQVETIPTLASGKPNRVMLTERYCKPDNTEGEEILCRAEE